MIDRPERDQQTNQRKQQPGHDDKRLPACQTLPDEQRRVHEHRPNRSQPFTPALDRHRQVIASMRGAASVSIATINTAYGA